MVVVSELSMLPRPRVPTLQSVCCCCRMATAFATFCYGPKSCPVYKAGAPRKVPGRKGMVYVEEDWVDEQETSHRGPDD